jgi:hypothetical protein
MLKEDEPLDYKTLRSGARKKKRNLITLMIQ